jgi:hypothetical protein
MDTLDAMDESFLDYRTFVLYNNSAFIRRPLMSNSLISNPSDNSLNYSGLFPFASKRKGIRTSQKLIFFYSKVFGKTRLLPVATTSAGGVEPQSNWLRTAVNWVKKSSFLAKHPGRVAEDPVPHGVSAFYSVSAWEGIRSSQKLIFFYSKLQSTAYQSAEQEILIQRSSIWGNMDLTDKQDSLPFREGDRRDGGLGPEGGFDPDSFRVCTTVNKAKMRPP